VRVAACGISLERAGVDPSALVPSVEVVPNGLVEVLRLQRDGFLSVEP
jgi:intracellular sulfur oxidation DsrE/DsrF family protein